MFCRLIDDYPPYSFKVDDIYECSSEGKPILHKTVIHLCVERDSQIEGQYISFLEPTKVDDQLESTKVIQPTCYPLDFSIMLYYLF